MNKSQILKQAWVIFRKDNLTFADALKKSWAMSKAPKVEAKPNSDTAFNALYTKYHEVVYNFIRKYYPNDIDAVEQITSDTFMNVHKSFDSFDCTKSQMQTWILNIAKNLRNDYYRKNTKKSKLTSKLKISNPKHNKACFIEDNVQKDDIKSSVNNAMNRLTQNQQQMARLRFEHQMGYEEIAEFMCIPLGTVKGTLNRIKKQLANDPELVSCYMSMYN